MLSRHAGRFIAGFMVVFSLLLVGCSQVPKGPVNGNSAVENSSSPEDEAKDSLKRELNRQGFAYISNVELYEGAIDKGMADVNLLERTAKVHAQRINRQWHVGCLDYQGNFVSLINDRYLAEVFYGLTKCPPAYVSGAEPE